MVLLTLEKRKLKEGSSCSLPLPKERRPGQTSQVHGKRARGNGHRLQPETFQPTQGEKRFFNESGLALEQVSQRGVGISITGYSLHQDLIGQGPDNLF